MLKLPLSYSKMYLQMYLGAGEREAIVPDIQTQGSEFEFSIHVEAGFHGLYA